MAMLIWNTLTRKRQVRCPKKAIFISISMQKDVNTVPECLLLLGPKSLLSVTCGVINGSRKTPF
jgi:hypothetical protein